MEKSLGNHLEPLLAARRPVSFDQPTGLGSTTFRGHPAANADGAAGSHRRSGWRFSLAGAWPETPDARETCYSAGFTYRRRIHRDWLFLDITPGVDFPRTEAYAAQPYIGIKFEAIFGGE